jgi:hypothetical protein
MIGIITTIVLLMVHNIKDTFATMATSTSSRTNESCDLYGLIPENTLVQISSDSTSRPKPIQTTGKILDVVVGLHSTYALDTLGTVTQTRPNKPTQIIASGFIQLAVDRGEDGSLFGLKRLTDYSTQLVKLDPTKGKIHVLTHANQRQWKQIATGDGQLWGLDILGNSFQIPTNDSPLVALQRGIDALVPGMHTVFGLVQTSKNQSHTRVFRLSPQQPQAMGIKNSTHNVFSSITAGFNDKLYGITNGNVVEIKEQGWTPLANISTAINLVAGGFDPVLYAVCYDSETGQVHVCDVFTGRQLSRVPEETQLKTC